MKKALINAILISCILMALVTLGIAFIYNHQEEKNLNDRLEASASDLVSNLSFAVMIYDYQEINRVLENSGVVKSTPYFLLLREKEIITLKKSHVKKCEKTVSKAIIYEEAEVGKIEYCEIDLTFSTPPVEAFVLYILGVAAFSILFYNYYLQNSKKYLKLVSDIKSIEVSETTYDSFKSDSDDLREVYISVKQLLTAALAYETEKDLLKKNSHIVMGLRQFVHDIQSPISALEVLEKNVDGENSELVSMIHNSLKSSTERLAQQNIELKKTTISNIYKLTLGIQKMKMSEYPSLNLKLETKAGHEDLIGIIEPHTLTKVMSNLINNSIEASSLENCDITLTLDRLDRYITILIADNSGGIPSDVVPFIFEQGFSSKKTGSGLGLFGARNEIEKMGGNLDLIRNNSLGCCFEIKLLASK